MVDNTDPSVVAVGSWPTSSSVAGYYGPNYRYAGGASGANVFTWPAPVPEAGRYKAYVRWTAGSGRASNAPYTVTHATGTTTVTMNQKLNGRTWHLLGSYVFLPGQGHGVSLNNNANGTVIADAVRFVRDTSAPTGITLRVQIG